MVYNLFVPSEAFWGILPVLVPECACCAAWAEGPQVRSRDWPGGNFPPSYICPATQAFFVIRREGGGGAILEEAGTFSGQALLLSYPYPKGGGGPVKEAGTHSISNHTQHPAQGWNRYFTLLNLFPHKISPCPTLLFLSP